MGLVTASASRSLRASERWRALPPTPQNFYLDIFTFPPRFLSPTMSAEDVAANWREGVDQKSGKTYYYNVVTKTSSWTKPACMNAAAASPEAAKTLLQGKSSRSLRKGRSQISGNAGASGTAVAGMNAATSGGGGGRGASSSSSVKESEFDDPAFWRAGKDEKTGKTYYFNTRTKKSTWAKPACLSSGSLAIQSKVTAGQAHHGRAKSSGAALSAKESK